MHDSIELRVARNAPRLLLYLGIGAIVSTVALRIARSVPVSLLTAVVRPLLAFAQAMTSIFFILILVMLGCAVLSLLLGRLFGAQSSSFSRRFLAVFIAVAVLAFIFAVPMCFGSLGDGTYECVTLARRAMSFAKGA